MRAVDSGPFSTEFGTVPVEVFGTVPVEVFGVIQFRVPSVRAVDSGSFSTEFELFL